MKYLTLNLFVVLLGCDGNGPTPVSDASVDSNVRPDAIADTSVADTHIVVPDGGTRALGPNDISILFPFDRGELWPASAASFSEALFGEINPTRFPGLVGNGSGGIFPNLDANAQYASLRVVSLRIEPCSAGCAAQLRFILQSKGTSTFRDGAVHVVHNLNAQQFVELRARVLELQVVSPENADPVLKVNPALAAQGLGGAFGSALRQRISASASTVTLHRVTFMTRGGARESEWEFGGLEIANGAVTTTVTIPGYAASTRFQFLEAPTSVNVFYRLSLDGSRTPVSHPDPAFDPAFRVTELMGRPMSEQQSAYDAIVRRHNPTALTPDTTDCVGCHISSPVRSRAFLRTFASTMTYGSEAAARRMFGAVDETRDNLRMFGYFETAPVVSQRVANDTHLSLAMWNQ